MKIKFGDLTVRQLDKICAKNEECRNCPLCKRLPGVPPFYICDVDPTRTIPSLQSDRYEEEIDLPDEEVKQDAAIH